MEREWLVSQLASGRSIEAIASDVAKDPSTVAYCANKFGLVSLYAARHAAMGLIERQTLEALVEEGLTAIRGSVPMRGARSENVARCRRRLKQKLIDEHGGSCRLCGYDRYAGALEFHHVDPQERSFALSMNGVARSLARAREEARKCVLVCANCHAEIEGGVAIVPRRSTAELVEQPRSHISRG